MNKIVVYTAIYGNYISLKDAIPSDNCDFVCFTDNTELKSDTWKVIYIDGFSKIPRRNAKIYKILPHRYFKEYEYSIWVDGTHIPTDPSRIVDKYLGEDKIALFKHNKRNCIYEELKACIKQKKDNEHIMRAQVQSYKEDNYPANNGLATCSVILRRHNDPSIIKAMEDWWAEIEKYSTRDQLSFNYVMYKNNLPYRVIGGHINHSSRFIVENHKLSDNINHNGNMYIIDCGGWQGDSVIELRKKFDPNGEYTCHSFEPNTYFIPYYKKFKKHVLHTEAVWVHDGEIDFHLQQEQGRKHHMGSSIYGRDIKANVREEAITVPCMDFSKWILDNFNRYDYIILKMDIEGAEYKVMEKMIRDGSMDYINIFFLEQHRKKMTNFLTKEDVIKIFNKIKIPIGRWR